MGRFSIWELLIVLVIIILLFGTKKLRNIGGDLGGALKSFKKALKEEDKNPETENSPESSGNVINGNQENTTTKNEKET
ncbi:MAG TPA: Sec-independent protein translocase subunit TatA [Gammaproteobacteria bacterium]